MRKYRKKGLCLLLLAAMAAGGCGVQETEEREEQIELLEPVDDVSGWEAAACRNLYDAKVYSAYVYPETEEYIFEKNVLLGGVDAYWGQHVEQGGILAHAEDGALEESIRKKEEQIRDMEKEFKEYQEDTEKALAEPEAEAARLLGIVEAYRNAEPEKYLTAGGESMEESGAGGAAGADGSGVTENVSEGAEGKEPEGKEPVISPAYQEWQETFRRYEGDYRILNHSNNTIRLQLEQRAQLYELDMAYAKQELAGMQAELKKGKYTSSVSGEVMALNLPVNEIYFNENSRVTAMAVGDPEKKLLKSEYINRASVAGAKEIYALIDGIRREVEYQPMDSDEYSRLSSSGTTVYSTFVLQEEPDISLGDFAVIVLVKDSRENVLSVPESAIHTDAGGEFVYRKQGEESRAAYVETGMSDGVYREILSGLEEGDLILNPESITVGEGRGRVELGSFHVTFSGSGFLVYPSSEKVKNPVEYGTAYLTEYTIARYDHVEKGDVIAKIRVEPDEVALQRSRIRLERLLERREMLERRDAEGNARAIADLQEEIEETQELIGEMETDFSRKQVTAQKSGIVIGLGEYQPEDILDPECALAEIADEDTGYVMLENENQLLQYGNEVTVSYMGREGKTGSTRGNVANLSQCGVSDELKSDYSMIRIPPEAIGDIPAALEDRNGWLMRNYCTVEADIRKMDNVLIVPKKAVWEISGNTYVFAVREDGTVAATAFIAGGYDSSGYWVVDGLEEGMELCLK